MPTSVTGHRTLCDVFLKRTRSIQQPMTNLSLASSGICILHYLMITIFGKSATVLIGWQWRNFFIPIYASCSGRHDVGHENVNIYSTDSQIADLALAISFS